MKKFKFTLQAVHNVREMKKEKEQLILSELQAEASRAEDRVREIEQLRAKAMETYARRLESGRTVDPYELELNSNHISALDRLQREAQKTLEIKKQACQRQTKSVEAAAREVKITGRLRETQNARYQLELARQEQNALDELVSANYARRMAQAK